MSQYYTARESDQVVPDSMVPDGRRVTKVRATIWEGIIEFYEKASDVQGGTRRVKHSWPCTFSTVVKNGERRNVNADKWPNRLYMGCVLVSQKRDYNLLDSFEKDCWFIAIHFKEESDTLAKLRKTMSHRRNYRLMGFIQFPNSCDIRMMAVVYIAQHRIHLGLIPHDQEKFFNKVSQILQNLRNQSQEQRKIKKPAGMGCGGTKPAGLQKNNGGQGLPTNLSKVQETGSIDVGMVIPEKGSSQIKPVEITVETLQKYLDMEKEIQLFEKKHVLDNYQLKSDQIEQLEKTLLTLQESRNAQAQSLHQLQAAIDTTNGNQSLKKFLFEKSQSGKSLNEDEEEYVDLLNRQEVIERQLESTTKQRDILKEEISALTIDGELFQKLYQKRDELLDSIFGGAYGSERENRLEKEFDCLQERKNHIDQAHFKWKQAQIMVKQACAQLGLAVQKWKELLEIPENDMEQRYYHAAETRNNLVAASQNLQGAHGFLPNISFPYCADDEVDTLNKAVTFIFTDMQTPERFEHALNCYHTTYRRSGALRQWFEQVLNTTISKDLAEISEESKLKAQELRQERIHLIKQKVKEITGKDVDFDTGSLDTEAEDLAADEQVAKLFEAERLEGKNQNFLTANSNLPPAPTPVPVSDLAPMPTNEEIFGKIDELRKKHAVEMADFEKAQTMNKVRTTQGLQEKLQARRSRRSRMQNHEREIEEMQSA